MAGGNTVPMPRRQTTAGKKPKLPPLFNLSSGFDMQFFVLLMIILIVGLATLYSASHVYAFEYEGDSFFYIRKQLIFAVAGFVIMLLVSMMDYHYLHWVALIGHVASLILLVIAYFMPSATGIHRWIEIGGITIQPSEIAKFTMVLLFAHYIAKNYKDIRTFKKGFIPLLAILGVTCFLVVIEPHLSGTMLIGIVGLGVVGVLVMVVVLGYEQDRIAVWLHPLESFANEITFADGLSGRDHAWQTVQSLYAIGSGGLMGQGPGNSRQKHLFLPEPQNDFIFSIFCEEMGLVGAILVLILFALLMWRGFKIAMKAPDKFGCMLALGLTLQIGIQVALNVAVVSNLMPNTGISLPFFSYGGTSLLMLMVQMGVVLSVSRQARMEKL